MPDILKVTNLKKAFDDEVAVDGISFSVQKGEIFGLLGPNGAGKTTTIQMLLGVLEQDAGEIEIFGKPFAPNREEILGKMNFSSSYTSLPWNLTVEENLNIFARLYSVPDRRNAVEQTLQRFGLGPRRRTLTGKLSSGQLTMLFLAKALINQPELLLLDEPTASLDPDVAERVRDMLMSLVREQGVTLVYTSHNMVEVERVCDRLIFLNHGRIIATGTPTEVVRSYGRANLEELFIHLIRDSRRGGDQ